MAEAKEGIPANQLEENPDLDVEREVITFVDSSNKGYKHNAAPNFPKGKVFEFTDQTTPATPATDQTKFYAKSDGMYYLKDDGNETKLLDFAGATLSKFHTNFSPTHIKEDTEDSSFLTQYGVVDRIGYGYQTGFDSIDPDTMRLKQVQQAVVPAVSHEIDYVGTWSNTVGASYLYKENKTTSTSNGYLEFEFTGTSITLVSTYSTNRGITKAQISRDGGSTWFDEKKWTDDVSTVQYSVPDVLWENLPEDDYTVRITNVTGTLGIEALAYTIHANPYSITNYYHNTDAKTIDDIPFGHWLLSGTYPAINAFSSDVWNSRYLATTDTTGATTAEIKFYGNKVFLNSHWVYNSDIQFSIQFDTGSGYSNTYNKSNLFSTKSGDVTNNPNLYGITRLDNGALPDGQINKLKITFTGGTSQVLFTSIHVSSDLADSTHCFGLMTGRQEVISIEDDRVTLGTNWTLQDRSNGLLRRRAVNASSQNDFTSFDISGLSNIKAIYISNENTSSGGKAVVDLGSGNKTRYYSTDSSLISLGSQVHQLYDYKTDGDLDQAEFRIAWFSDGAEIDCEAIIIEYYDETATDGTGVTGLNHINIHPKMSRYNNSNNANGWKSAVSNTYRFEIEGEKTDDSQPRKPICGTGFLFSDTNDVYFNHGGIPSSISITKKIRSTIAKPTFKGASDGVNTSAEVDGTFLSDNVPGIARQRIASNTWVYDGYEFDYVI
jgi:hypothetical protein